MATAAKAHSYIRIKRFPWAVCGACGLIALRNAATAKADRQPCSGQFREHVYIERKVVG